ncbi:histidine kinase [Spirosoma fluminis]
MTYEAWLLFFLGIVTAMLLYNVVQWGLYRERIYGLYTAYMLVWLSYFALRAMDLPDNLANFVRIVGPMFAYFVYYDFTIAFVNIRDSQPRLMRLFRVTQVGLVAYVAVEIGFCLLTDYWQQPIHELIHSLARTVLAVLSGYIIVNLFQRKDLITRFFITGSALLVFGGLVAMILTLVWTDYQTNVFWNAPIAYMQIGIILELMFFSLGLSYRHRQDAVKRAMFEQALTREREQRWRAQLEAELAVQRLKQEVTEMHMRALQAQLSPHFLFNSLNSLSSLIADDPIKAERFVDELSSVYRYLLQASDRELTTLATEMKFISSYYHLLKTRYGQGICLQVDIHDTYQEFLLPPLTLQLLVENAVKHNVVSPNNPLTIRIYTDNDGALVVRNNLQRKRLNRLASTKKGLENINLKYKLLNQPAIDICETDDAFDVIVPLIPSTEELV